MLSLHISSNAYCDGDRDQREVKRGGQNGIEWNSIGEVKCIVQVGRKEKGVGSIKS
jgi:hypothetical protein